MELRPNSPPAIATVLAASVLYNPPVIGRPRQGIFRSRSQPSMRQLCRTPGWRKGRRSGLKIRRPKGHPGSNPGPGTI